MYVSILFMYNPHLIKDIILVIHKIVSFQEKEKWKSALLKKSKKSQQKTLSYFSLEP